MVFLFTPAGALALVTITALFAHQVACGMHSMTMRYEMLLLPFNVWTPVIHELIPQLIIHNAFDS